MNKEIQFSIHNRLIKEKRDLNIYHNSTRTSYMISHDNSITIPISIDESNDFLHLSIVSGPGNMEQGCRIALPSWSDFAISSIGNGEIVHTKDRTIIIIPPGLQLWQLKVTLSSRNTNQNLPELLHFITISDSEFHPKNPINSNTNNGGKL